MIIGKSFTKRLSAARFSTIPLPQKDVGLAERDPEMASLLRQEIDRQKKGKFC